jgi:hypothetical protein
MVVGTRCSAATARFEAGCTTAIEPAAAIQCTELCTWSIKGIALHLDISNAC